MSKNAYPAFDLQTCVARLPAHGKRKYNALLAQVSDAEAAVRSTQERSKQLRDQLDRVERQLGYCSDREEVEQLREEHELLVQDLDQCGREMDRRNGIRRNAEQVLAQLNAYLPIWLGGPHGDARGLRQAAAEVTVSDRADLTAAIMEVRSQIARARAELVQVKAAPPSAAEVREAITAWVDRLSREGRPIIRLDDGKVALSFADDMPYAAPGAALSAPAGSASRLLCWLLPERLRDELLVGVDAIKGITAADRASRVAELEAEVLRLQHREEALVTAALEANLECHRDPYSSPFALLAIELPSTTEVLPAEAAE